MKAVILAGGGGTRLWPLSREDFPKQFLRFEEGLSLLQKTALRLLKAPFIDQIIVATNLQHLSLVQEQLSKLEGAQKIQLLLEPCRRNTAPAIGFAVKYLQECCQVAEGDPIIVVPSDHYMEPEELFIHALEQVDEAILDKAILTFGIRPTKPETGYGYIQMGKKKGPFMFEVVRFVEKPDRATAEKYLKDPHFYWNAGMFLFSAGSFWKQMQRVAPDLYSLFSGTYEEVKRDFEKMPDVSMDYAILEKSKEVLVCPLPISWSDVGCWDSVYEILEKDQNQNVKRGQVFDLDTKNSLIFSGKRLISTIGLEDLLIVETEDALFISKKGESQRVKNLVQELIKSGKKVL